jgi:2-polyprenyl-3-methyl-5-hydroxy-6-metoxy-1,4-benzoquinol methylase
LEHLYYPDQVLKKIFDRLAPGGFLLGSIPHAFSLQSRARLMMATKKGTALQDPTHINHFWGPEFKRLVESAGFVDVEVIDITSKKFSFLSKLFPYAFAHSFVFSARRAA